MTDADSAFKWIVGILEKNKIPFQITGGLAAVFYGSKRPLYDIDIEIPTDRFDDLKNDVEGYTVFGPERYVDDRWDLFMLTLRYNNQPIDIGSAEVKIRQNEKEPWSVDVTDFSKSVYGEIFGIKVPIVPKYSLINYKKILNRETDLEDINAIT